MSTTALTGINFAVAENDVWFFFAHGIVMDGRWMINALPGKPDRLVNVPTGGSMSTKIAAVVDEAPAGWVANRLGQVQLGARQAVVLFLEGVLDAEMVSGAVEDYDEDGEPYIQINYVELGGRIVSVRVYEVLEARIVLADAEGHPAD
jgi:hypothetical protein